jgi:hypothetical protein
MILPEERYFSMPSAEVKLRSNGTQPVLQMQQQLGIRVTVQSRLTPPSTCVLR